MTGKLLLELLVFGFACLGSEMTCFITPVPHGVDDFTVHNIRMGTVRW